MNENVINNRDKYIGGSDLPTILGLNSKYNVNIFEFAKEKVGIIPKEFTGNEYTKYGQVLEPVIRDYINLKYNCKYKEDTAVKDILRGNTDGIDKDAEIPLIEIKTFGTKLDVEYYTPQCQFYMELFNKNSCRLIGYKRPKNFYTGIDYSLESNDEYFDFSFDENNIVEYVIERDKDVWSKILQRIVTFHNALIELKKNPDMTEEEFNKLFYGNQLIQSINKLKTVEQAISKYNDIVNQYEDLKNKIYKVFEEKNILSLDTGETKLTRVLPTSYERTSIDTSKLKKEEPIIYNEYKVVKTINKKGYLLINKKEAK